MTTESVPVSQFQPALTRPEQIAYEILRELRVIRNVMVGVLLFLAAVLIAVVLLMVAG